MWRFSSSSSSSFFISFFLMAVKVLLQAWNWQQAVFGLLSSFSVPVVAVGLRCRVCKDGYRGLWSSLHFVHRLSPVRSFEINPAEFFLFNLAPDPDLFPLLSPSAEKCAPILRFFLSFSFRIFFLTSFFRLFCTNKCGNLMIFPFRVVHRWTNSRKWAR